MLDLKRFSKTTQEIVPFVNGWGKTSTGRRIELKGEDTWRVVKYGDSIESSRKATLLEIKKECDKFKMLKGYPLGDEVIPYNFQNLFRLGYGETVNVNFLQSNPWTIVHFIRHFDNRFYSAGPAIGVSHSLLSSVKKAFEKEKDLSKIKGIDPSLHYYFLLMSLQRQSYKELEQLEKLKLSQAEREKRLKIFQSTFPFRLKDVLEKAGSNLIRFEKYGKDKYLVTWKSGSQIIKTIIKDNFRIWDAGFCLENADKKFTLGSLSALAKQFQDEKPLYILRE